MDYFFSKIYKGSFEEAKEKVAVELSNEGFGILSEIDVQATLKKKIDVDFRKYVILGACSPVHAHKALSSEPHIGLMLPCNVVIQEGIDGKIEISAIDPIASMSAVDNTNLIEIANEVRKKLKKVIESL